MVANSNIALVAFSMEALMGSLCNRAYICVDCCDLWLRDLAPSIGLLNDWKGKKIREGEIQKIPYLLIQE